MLIQECWQLLCEGDALAAFLPGDLIVTSTQFAQHTSQEVDFQTSPIGESSLADDSILNFAPLPPLLSFVNPCDTDLKFEFIDPNSVSLSNDANCDVDSENVNGEGDFSVNSSNLTFRKR